MKTVAVVCNVLFWAFLCMVLLTDGPPVGTGIWVSLVTFLIPIFNVLVIRVLSTPGRNLRIIAFFANVFWLAVATWRIVTEYPGHPAEEGVLAFTIIMALTPILSALTLLLSLRHTPEPVLAR